MRVLILEVLLHHCHVSSYGLSFLDMLHALVSAWLIDLFTASLSISEEFEMARLDVILYHWLLHLLHGLFIDIIGELVGLVLLHH